MEDDPEKVESRWLSFSVTPDLKNGSRFKNIFYDTDPLNPCGSEPARDSGGSVNTSVN
jgi:hypothetical protein